MKINRVIEGQFSEIKLGDGKKIFLSVLPDRITASTMFLFLPIKKIWEFIFPFYIRTSAEAWESSKRILKLTLNSIVNVNNLEDLMKTLEDKTSKALWHYVQEYGEEAREISVDKVGIPALKQMLSRKGLQKTETIIHEFGKVIEKTSQETVEKYPALVYPESLLPYSKDVIKNALEQSLQYIQDSKMRENIKVCLQLLNNFIADEEANNKNAKILEMIKNKKISDET